MEASIKQINDLAMIAKMRAVGQKNKDIITQNQLLTISNIKEISQYDDGMEKTKNFLQQFINQSNTLANQDIAQGWKIIMTMLIATATATSMVLALLQEADKKN